MSNRTTPLSVSVQPGKHLSIDSRPCTAESSQNGSGLSHNTVRFIHFNSSHLVKSSIYVTSPFKQGRQRTYQDFKTFYDVSSPIKHEIVQTLSLYKQINYKEDVEIPPSVQKNRLFHVRQKKGRLLPLLGVPAVKGPAIQECIGILPGSKKLSRGGKTDYKTCFGNHMLTPKKLPHVLLANQSSFRL